MNSDKALKEFNEKFSLNIENTDVKELDFDEKNKFIIMQGIL